MTREAADRRATSGAWVGFVLMHVPLLGHRARAATSRGGADRLARRRLPGAVGVGPAHDQLAVGDVDLDRRAVEDLAREQRAADPRLDFALDEAPQRPRAVDG